MNFIFTNEYPIGRIDEIVSYLLGPRLWIQGNDYPDFLDWANKTYDELKKEQKRALVAIQSNKIVGVTIYQQHKKEKEALEIKNLTVRPDARGRYIASFLLRNSEIEGLRDFKSKYILCDAKENNFAIRGFLLKHHYRSVTKADLYHLGMGDDIVYKKRLDHLNFLH